MKTHLRDEHRIDENIAREHKNWIENSNNVILERGCIISCRHCQKCFTRNYFSLMKHLITHKVDVPLEFK